MFLNGVTSWKSFNVSQWSYLTEVIQCFSMELPHGNHSVFLNSFPMEIIQYFSMELPHGNHSVFLNGVTSLKSFNVSQWSYLTEIIQCFSMELPHGNHSIFLNGVTS